MCSLFTQYEWIIFVDVMLHAAARPQKPMKLLRHSFCSDINASVNLDIFSSVICRALVINALGEPFCDFISSAENDKKIIII